MNSLRHIATALAPALIAGHHIGSAIRTIPHPRIDTQLAAEALRKAGRGVRKVARQVASVFVPPQPTPSARRLQAFTAFAVLAETPPRLQGQDPKLEIPSAKELADNLRESGEAKLARMGQSLDTLAALSRKLAQDIAAATPQAGLEPHQALAVRKQVQDIVATAHEIKAAASGTHHGYSLHLMTWMDQLTASGHALLAEAASHNDLKFLPTNQQVTFEKTLAPLDVASRTVTRTLSKASPQGERHVRFVRTSTAARLNPPDTSSSTSASESENLLDFSGVNRHVNNDTGDLIAELNTAIRPLMATIDMHEDIALDEKPGSETWCHSVAAVIGALGSISELLRTKGQLHADTTAINDGLLDWFDQKIEDVFQQSDVWVSRAERHAPQMQALGYRFMEPVQPQEV